MINIFHVIQKNIRNLIDFSGAYQCIKLYFQPKNETHYFCYLHFLSLGTAQAATILSTTNTNTANNAGNNYFGSAPLPVHFSIHQFFQHHFSFGSALRNTAYFCLQDIGIKVGSVLLQFQSVNIILIFHASSALMNIGSHLPVTLV